MYVRHCPVEGSYLKVIFVIQKKRGDGSVTAILETFLWRKSLGSNLGLKNRPNKWNMSKPIESAILKTQIHPYLPCAMRALFQYFISESRQLQLYRGLIAPIPPTNVQPHSHFSFIGDAAPFQKRNHS